MNAWTELHRAHLALRTATSDQKETEFQKIRKRLHALGEKGCCDPSLPMRFSAKKKGSVREYLIAPRSGHAAPTDWSEPLKNLREGIENARLSILAMTNTSDSTVDKLDLRLDGRASGTEFVVAIHLDDGDRRMGDGACTHPTLHCHVGPSLSHFPKVRVPLPALPPSALLDWLIGIVVDNWDPAPWSDVVQQLQRQPSTP